MSRFTRVLLTLLFILLFVPSLKAVNITGLVKDVATGDPLMEASIRLLAAKDSAFVKGVSTNINGRFKIEGVKAGKYILVASYIGYADTKQDITVGASNLRLGTIEMKETSELLGVVEVVAVKTPIKVMEDTVEYNADSYHTQPNAVVEDLLKRLPGVEVDTDGSITANGKTVSKILIDGKEFFSDDPQVASKNLPANMIDKLQVVDRKSDMARLTGVDDGEDETVINLTFKRGMNQGWFGTAEAGYGTDERYMGSFNVNRFWDGNQVTLLGNFNNTNQIGFTDSNGNRFRRFGGNNGITISKALGLNFNVGKEEIIRIGGDLMWSNTDAKTIQRQERENTYEDYSTWNKSSKRARDKGNNVRGDFRILWKPDSFNTLEFRPNFSLNFNRSTDSEVESYFNRDYTKMSDNTSDGNSKGDSYEAGGRLIYSHRFNQRRGRSFSVSGQYRFSDVTEKETSYNDFIRYITEEDPDNTEDDSELLNQWTDNHTWNNQVMGQFTWTEPLGNIQNGNYVMFSYRANYRWNNADKLVYNIPDRYNLGIYPPVGEEPDMDYSNRYRNNYFNQNIRLGYRKVTAKANLELGMALVPQMSKSIFLDNSDKNIDRWVWNFAPFMRFRYKFSKQRSLQMNYRGNSSQPSMTQLQPVLNISNPTNKIQGNPNLDPSFSHNIMMRFQDFNIESQRSIMLMSHFTFTQNSIISKTSTDEYGARLTEYVNANGVWNGMLMNMFSMPFRNKKWSFSNNIFINANRKVGFNNGLRNASLSFRINESPSITFRPDNFEFELRPRYSIQTTHNTLQSRNDQTVHTYGGRFDGTYYTPWGLTLQTDVNYSATAGYAAGFNTKTWIWNATISQQFLRDKSLTLAIKIYDILDQRSSIRRSVSANAITDSEYNTLSRYGMVTISYRFNTFGKGNEPQSRNGFGGPGRFGGPGGGRGPR
ncbi:MAG: outer membrane beta-barrel protein [Muribaculaceae bacterium]|nr:outer membrane beta-barrel protein [Muribaculaceae bacterium]